MVHPLQQGQYTCFEHCARCLQFQKGPWNGLSHGRAGVRVFMSCSWSLYKSKGFLLPLDVFRLMLLSLKSAERYSCFPL